MSPDTGAVLFTQPLRFEASRFIVSYLKNAESQVILAIGKDQTGNIQIEAYPKDVFPHFKS